MAVSDQSAYQGGILRLAIELSVKKKPAKICFFVKRSNRVAAVAVIPAVKISANSGWWYRRARLRPDAEVNGGCLHPCDCAPGSWRQNTNIILPSGARQ